MKIWVAVTDHGWFEYLRERRPDEVNFWQPTASRRPRALEPGELFLFKLHSPRNYIVGGGFFVRYSPLLFSLAWTAFGEKNGVANQAEFLARIRKYRQQNASLEPDPVIGCNVLAQPFFFRESAWIPVPSDWARNIVQGKTDGTDTALGAELWTAVRERMVDIGAWSQNEVRDEERGERPEYLIRGRLGQGAFRVLVTDAYRRRCAITGERTLPVLEAAHIKPYASSGPNLVQNGLLLRSDLHKLFDLGYLTVTPELRIEVSKKIKEQYENGREYYEYHGRPLFITPDDPRDRPSKDFLSWHNEHVYVP